MKTKLRPSLHIDNAFLLNVCTNVALIGCLLHVACMFQREYGRCKREYQEARFTYEDLCTDPVKKDLYGRFHVCDEVLDTLSMNSLIVVAADRAIASFFHSVKTQTFNDLTHVGLITILGALACLLIMKLLVYFVSTWTDWSQIRREREYESRMMNKRSQIELKMD